jgi:hypothetical protein
MFAVCCRLGYAAFKQYSGRFEVTQVYSGRKLWKAVASLDLRVKI